MTPGPDMTDHDPGPDMEERDPGLARERTALAWTRTAISVAALGGATLKTNPPAGIVVLAMSAPVWWLGHPLRHERPGPPNAHRLLLITITVTLVSCAALALALQVVFPADLVLGISQPQDILGLAHGGRFGRADLGRTSLAPSAQNSCDPDGTSYRQGSAKEDPQTGPARCWHQSRGARRSAQR